MDRSPTRNLSLAALLAIGTLGAVPTGLSAAVITNGCERSDQACTLAELARGGSIRIEDQIFADWFVEDSSTLTVDISGIDVIPLDDQPLNPGLQFNGNGALSTIGLDLIDLTLGFTVSTVDGAARINDNSLEITGHNFGAGNSGGFITIFEDVFDATGALIGEKFVTADNADPPILDLFDSAAFSPVALVSVEKTILLAGDSENDTVTLETFTQRFSQVPEPASWVLVMLGLLGAGLTRRGRRRS